MLQTTAKKSTNPILGVDKVHLFPDNVDVFSSEIVRNLTNRQTCMRGY